MQYVIQPSLNTSTNWIGLSANAGRRFAFLNLETGLALTATGGTVALEPWRQDASQVWTFQVYGTEAQQTPHGLAVVPIGAIYNPAMGVAPSSLDLGLVGSAQRWTLGYSPVSSGFTLSDGGRGLGLVQAPGAIPDVKLALRRSTPASWKAVELVDAAAFQQTAQFTFYEQVAMQGASITLGTGLHKLDGAWNDRIRSFQGPSGYLVRLYQHFDPKLGVNRDFQTRSDDIGPELGGQVSLISIQPAAVVCQGLNYGNPSNHVRVGAYGHVSDVLSGGNDKIRSVRVPRGMTVVLYEHANFKGRQLVLFEDTPELDAWWRENVSSLRVLPMGVAIPHDALRFGGQIALQYSMPTFGQSFLSGGDDGVARVGSALQDEQRFTVERAGQTRLKSQICFGDHIALRTHAGKYLSAQQNGTWEANRDAVGGWETFKIERAGHTISDIFVSPGDTIALKTWHGTYLTGSTGASSPTQQQQLAWSVDKHGLLRGQTLWVIQAYVPKPVEKADTGAGACDTAVCSENVCVVDGCGANACGAALCGVDADLITLCGAQASGLVLCGADVSAIRVCGAQAFGVLACGAQATGLGVCGADACGVAIAGLSVCGADVCGAAACGADACGAAACGADACGIDGCPAAACGIAASGVGGCGVAMDAGVCPVDSCGADACGVDVPCGEDSCGVDACPVDVVPGPCGVDII
ncbi:MAG: hypothetical protein H6739_06820 [Alphaproteobacteria bacterium]|nr:hypothetical protein [Alphaproteobacteria bacterium]